MRLWNDKAGWAKMRKKILDSPMSELDVAMLEKELSKVREYVCESMCVWCTNLCSVVMCCEYAVLCHALN